MSAHPTPAQLTAVHHALYNHRRLTRMNGLLKQLAEAMNLDANTELASNDVRNPPGSGPRWFFPDSGLTDNHVLDGATICDQIAAAILDMRRDVQAVTFPHADKTHLLTALAEEAASWTARAKAWRAPTNAAAQPLLDAIDTHVQASLAAAGQVRRYLKTKRELGFGT